MLPFATNLEDLWSWWRGAPASPRVCWRGPRLEGARLRVRTRAKLWPVADLQLEASLSWRAGNRLLDHAGMAAAVDARVVEHLLGALSALLLQQPVPLAFKAQDAPGDAVRWTCSSIEAAYAPTYEGFDLALGTHLGKKQLRVTLIDGTYPLTLVSATNTGVDWESVGLAASRLVETFEKLPAGACVAKTPRLEIENDDANATVVVFEFAQRHTSRAAGAA